MKKSFVLYHDQYDAIEDLTDSQKGNLLDMLFIYSRSGDTAAKTDDPMVKIAFKFFKVVMDRDKTKWENIASRNKVNGSKGGRPNKNSTMQGNPAEPKKPSGLSGNPKNPEEPRKAVSGSASVSASGNASVISKDIDHDFQKFWDLYDKKVDLKKCKAKWERLKQSDRDNIFKALPAYIASTPDKVYRKNPLTYLNGNGWESEIIKKDKGGAKKNGFNEPGYYGESTPENDFF